MPQDLKVTLVLTVLVVGIWTGTVHLTTPRRTRILTAKLMLWIVRDHKGKWARQARRAPRVRQALKVIPVRVVRIV